MHHFDELLAAVGDWLALVRSDVDAAAIVFEFPPAARRSAVLPASPAAQPPADFTAAHLRVLTAVRAFAAAADPQALRCVVTASPASNPHTVLDVSLREPTAEESQSVRTLPIRPKLFSTRRRPAPSSPGLFN